MTSSGLTSGNSVSREEECDVVLESVPGISRATEDPGSDHTVPEAGKPGCHRGSL
jgi:hypothetical protein